MAEGVRSAAVQWLAPRTTHTHHLRAPAHAELLLVRHGETQWNVEHRLQGQALPGPPLNPLGQAQAQAVARALAEPPNLQQQQQLRDRTVSAVYCSDLLRAVQTADVVAQGLRCKVRWPPKSPSGPTLPAPPYTPPQATPTILYSPRCPPASNNNRSPSWWN